MGYCKAVAFKERDTNPAVTDLCVHVCASLCVYPTIPGERTCLERRSRWTEETKKGGGRDERMDLSLL